MSVRLTNNVSRDVLRQYLTGYCCDIDLSVVVKHYTDIAVGQFSYDVVAHVSNFIYFYCKSFGILPSEEASVHAKG